MHTRSRLRALRGTGSERGIALPVALLVLLILSSILLALASLTATEPVIATNHYRASVARAMAESGLERAIWALTASADSPAPTGALAPPGTGVAGSAPYDGATWVAVDSLGGFTVRVTGVSTTEASVDAVGWHPSNTGGSSRIRSHRRVQAAVMRLPNLGMSAPCAVCVRGQLRVRGSASISAVSDTSCGNKFGVYTSDAVDISGSPEIRGADGDPTPNQSTDYAQNQPDSSFDEFTLSGTQLDALRAIARSSGTYYQGSVTFSASNRMADGVIFVDTVSGNAIDGTTSSGDFADVQITGNATASNPWRGWLVVNGRIRLAGNSPMNGLIYAVDDVDASTGNPTVNGLVISQNVRNDSRVDMTAGGTASISFNCVNASGASVVPQGWFLKAGTYREVAGQ